MHQWLLLASAQAPTYIEIMNDTPEDPIFEVPIDGTLDLHTFRPSDLKVLIPEYIEECHRRGIRQLRIIHGKGIGTLRETTHSLLKRHPLVADFSLADASGGGWGATLVKLLSQPTTES